MKICQLCAVDFTMARFLLPLMQAMTDAGHEVVGVCADGPELDTVRAAGIRVVPLPMSRSMAPHRVWPAFRALRRLFQQERFDLLHVHTPVAAVIGRAAAATAPVGRVVYTAHGFYFHDRMPLLKRAGFIAIEWLAGRITDTLFTQSAEDAETARRLHLCRSGDIMAIGNGSDPARFAPDPAIRARVRASFDIPDDRVVIASVGRLVAEKGFPELIAAMRDVDAELWVIGDRLVSDHADPIDDAIEMAATDPILRTRIRILGRRDDVPDLLRAADIFCLASHREGMPRSIIEAMLAGLPVVATDIRGSREEVVHRTTGTIVPVNNPHALATALQALANAPSTRDRMANEGLVRAQELHDERTVIDHQLDHLGLKPTATHKEPVITGNTALPRRDATY